MRRNTMLAAGLLVVLGILGCRPLMFWRKPLIHGETQIMGEQGRPPTGAAPSVTVNFIHHEGTLEETFPSVQTDPEGRYRSPELVPGTYTVEAMLPGHVIGRSVVEVRSHEYKRVDFVLYRIGEAEGHTLEEAAEDNIRAPGQVQIGRPKR